MGWWHKVTHAITKPFKALGHAVSSGLKGVFKAVTQPFLKTLTDTQGVASPQISAPAVAAPEPTQGQQESDLVSSKKKRTNKGKRALMIDSGGSAGSGGTTGTGLNL